MSVFDRIEEREMQHGTSRTFVTEKGNRYSHFDCEQQLAAAVRKTQRWFSRTIRTMTAWNDADMRDYEINHLRSVLGDITNYAEIIQRELDRLEGVNRTEERIKELREVAGRTPEETALYLQKAKDLESK